MIEVGFKVEKLAGPGKEKCFVQENSSEFVVTINFSLKSGLTQSNNNHNYTLIL
jgi:hypothetical protein